MIVKTRFNQGEWVFSMHENKLIQRRIIDIYVKIQEANNYIPLIEYLTACRYEVKVKIEEDKCFKTKEELLQSL